MGKHDTVGAVVVPSPPALRFCYAVSFTDVYYGLMRLLCHVWYWHMVTRICYAMSGTTQAMTLRICYAMPGIYPRLRNHQIPAEVMNKVARAEIGEVPESNRKNNSCLVQFVHNLYRDQVFLQWNIALSATFGTDVVSSHQGGRARVPTRYRPPLPCYVVAMRCPILS